MIKHQIEIDLTVLKELVAKYWNSPSKEKRFKSFKDKTGKVHNLLVADLCMPEPRYAEKADGSKIETATSVLQDTGFVQLSEKVGDEWVNENFAKLKQWVAKVDTTPPQAVKEEIQYPEDEINPADIPF